MKKSYLVVSFTIFVIAYVFYGFTSHNNSKISFFLNNELADRTNGDNSLIWVYFNDKGANTIADAINTLSKESLLRRKSKGKIDELDIPVYENYVNEVVNTGVTVKQKINMLNAISAYATREQIELITHMPFVKKVDLVAKFKKRTDDIELKTAADNTPIVINNTPDSPESMNYGASLSQMTLINAVTAQDSGYYGAGITIAVFDAGFDNLNHPCFDSIRTRGFRTKDFVNGDTNVANGGQGTGEHGTQTLSLIGGYKPGSLISPAYRSKFLLAKTENTASETPLEEDNWIAAVQWADNLGADIISSSLGYIAMDAGSIRTYDWTWMNGDSTVITKGANHAVDIGIVVVNSAGNEGYNATHNTLGAPSDGKKVICVGSVNSNKQRSSFSSVGLTTTGDIKPDVCALGNGNTVAQPSYGSGSPTGYTTGSGTSFSCPMTAGVVAQILQANKNLTPLQVRTILRTKADSSFAPNRQRGWGLINAWESIKLARTMTNLVDPSTIVPNFYLEQNYPNPFNPATRIEFNLKIDANVKIVVYNSAGKEVTTLLNEYKTEGSYGITLDANGLNSGVYFYAMYANGVLTDTKKMMLIK
ncbi:MAG: S8 family peptidase [Ignavibacteria bacterium]|nr:S8 family peptidase [Ignavibacteria bacterium]